MIKDNIILLFAAFGVMLWCVLWHYTTLKFFLVVVAIAILAAVSILRGIHLNKRINGDGYESKE